LLQLVFSIGLISSVVFFPLRSFSKLEMRWSHEADAAGSTLLVSVKEPQFNRIQRWIARVARRAAAPDEDASGLVPY